MVSKQETGAYLSLFIKKVSCLKEAAWNEISVDQRGDEIP
jgi:hypothetical protein